MIDGNALPNFIRQGNELEFSEDASGKELYNIHARNLLRHLVRGVPLCLKDGENYSNSPLAKSEIINSLFVKREPKLMDSFREEMQALLINAHNWLADPLNNASSEVKKRCETFLSFILSAYPFFDPEHHETVSIPTKINNTWELVDYQFEKIDISPTKGPLSWVLEDADRIYAYGLVTEKKDIPGHLLLMGTTYPAGQGSALAELYNVKPLHSVGEGHSFRSIKSWLDTQEKPVIVSGHSKGATMSMIAAARWPEKIQEANCFNPAGLSVNTLNRYQQSWIQLEETKRPMMNVLINQGDIVPYLDMGFFPGTKVKRVIPDTEKLAINFHFPSFLNFLAKGYEAHVHHFSGREKGTLVEVTLDEMNQAPVRQILHDIKWTANWPLFMLSYVELFASIVSRKIARAFEEYAPAYINLPAKFLGETLSLVGQVCIGILKVPSVLAGVAIGSMIGGIRVGLQELTKTVTENVEQDHKAFDDTMEVTTSHVSSLSRLSKNNNPEETNKMTIREEKVKEELQRDEKYLHATVAAEKIDITATGLTLS